MHRASRMRAFTGAARRNCQTGRILLAVPDKSRTGIQHHPTRMSQKCLIGIGGTAVCRGTRFDTRIENELSIWLLNLADETGRFARPAATSVRVWLRHCAPCRHRTSNCGRAFLSDHHQVDQAPLGDDFPVAVLETALESNAGKQLL